MDPIVSSLLISGAAIGIKIYISRKERLLQEHAKRQAEYLQRLQLVQHRAFNSLAEALQELAAQGLTNGIDSYGLFRDLEELLRLLCFDASHWRVRNSLRSAVMPVFVYRLAR